LFYALFYFLLPTFLLIFHHENLPGKLASAILTRVGDLGRKSVGYLLYTYLLGTRSLCQNRLLMH
jgi:hypothetical protein